MRVLLLILLFAVYQANTNCFDGGSPEKRPLDVCSWYSDETCCVDDDDPPIDYHKLPTYDNPCREPPDGCLDQLQLLVCIQCSPDISDYRIDDDDNEMRLCKKFGDKLYNACKTMEILEDDDEEDEVPCKEIGEIFENAEDFWVNGPYSSDFLYYDGNEDCFNAGDVIAPVILFIAAILTVLAF